MIALPNLMECLGLSSSRLPRPDCDIDNGIFFLQPDAPLTAGCMYLGTPAEIRELFSSVPAPAFPVTVFSAGQAPVPPELWSEGLNLISSDLSKEVLYNRLNRVYMHFARLHRVFADATHAAVSAQFMAELAAKHLENSPVFFLDSGYKVIASSLPSDLSAVAFPRFSSYIMSKLSADGYLAVDDVVSLNQFPSGTDGKHVFFKKIWKGEAPFCYFLVFFPSRMEITPYLRHTASGIHSELTKYFQAQVTTQEFSSEIHDFVSLLIRRRVRSTQEARTRLQLLGAPSFRYLTVMVLTFEGTPPVPTNYIAVQMQKAVPDSIVTTYEKDILILAPAGKSAEYPEFDRNTTEALLEACNGYMGIAFPVRSLLSLPTQYQDAKTSIACGRARFATRSSRIFWVHDFFIDRVLNLCSDTAHKDYHYGNLGYLCHPALITLLRYDRGHNTDFTKVLYQYLLCGQNIAECARKLFIHRNTLVNKLNKIEDIIGRSLDDSYFLHLLFFSYQAYTFSEEVLGKDILSLDK